MSTPGLGVMIQWLAGNDDSVRAYRDSIGKTIRALSLGGDDALHFEFDDGSKMKFVDEGQSCCESRYMLTDDDLAGYVGAKFLGADIKDAPNMEYEYGEHEVQFLEVQTDRGVFTMASHNEHNGYYGHEAVVQSTQLNHFEIL